MSEQLEARPSATLSHMPYEMLHEIATLLPTSDQVSMIRVCWTLLHVVSEVMYHRVIVLGPSAKLFFDALIYSRQDYGRHVRNLRFIATTNMRVVATMASFSAAVKRMQSLQKLTVDVRPIHIRFFMTFLQKYSMPLEISDNKKATYRSFFNTLPTLRSLALHGSADPLAIAVNHSLTSITITTQMGLYDFYRLVDLAEVTGGKNEVLRRLFIVLNKETGHHIDLRMETIGTSFPCLEYLSIRTPVGYALSASKALASPLGLFRHMKSFALNEESFFWPNYELPKDEALSLQQLHVETAGSTSKGLLCLIFGGIRWNRRAGKEDWTVKEDHFVFAPSDFREPEDVAYIFNDNPADTDYGRRAEAPLKWKTVYRIRP